jgi:hypothetical protein
LNGLREGRKAYLTKGSPKTYLLFEAVLDNISISMDFFVDVVFGFV